MSNNEPTTEYPILDTVPGQPDERLKAFLFNRPLPPTYAARLQAALSLATSCLAFYVDPGVESGSDNGQYARETIDEVTYLRLAPLPEVVP